MSTTYVPFAFYGRYFTSLLMAESFLAASGVDYYRDSVYDQKSNVLGLQYIQDGTYILGFLLQPGESDAAAKALWLSRFASSKDEARSHFEIFTY